MSEEIVTFGSARSLVGILHRPEANAVRADLPAVLLLNAGILHRVGPNRLYVRMARELERMGFHVLRFDVWGIGDSQDHTGPRENGTFFDDTLDAMELLRVRTNASRFMLMGICMGAQIALEVASRDPRVDSLVLMEGIYVKSVRYHVSRVLDPNKWKRALTGQSHKMGQMRRYIAGRLGKMLGKREESAPASKTKLVLFLDENRENNMKGKLAALIGRGTKIFLVFRDGNEIAYNYRLRKSGDDIFAVGLPTGLDVAFVRFADHTFTPLISQDLLLKTTMRWIGNTHSIQRTELKIAA